MSHETDQHDLLEAIEAANVPESREKTVDPKERLFPCGQCGAKVAFEPGTDALKCPYCQHVTPIDAIDLEIEEQDFRAELERLAATDVVEEHATIKCTACAAEVDRPPHVDAMACPYCDHNIVATATSRKLIRPASLLPFHINRKEATTLFRTWLKSLWFAPSKLKKAAQLDSKLSGMYIPYWTYDSDTLTNYVGQRGEHYWDTERYTAIETGKSVTRTRRVRKTRWYPAAGVVSRQFDDVLVPASHSLPDKHINALEPWDLENLIPYADDYLAGFIAESYQVELAPGFDIARVRMEPIIRQDINRDIGGDEQRIHQMHTEHRSITYKHILLPVWVSAYRWKNKVYRFIINARTGEVRGERPYSPIKIGAVILAGLFMAGAIAVGFMMTKGG